MIVEAERFGTHKRKLLYLDMLLTQQSDTSTQRTFVQCSTTLLVGVIQGLQDMNEKEGSIDRHFSSFFIHSFIVLDDLIRNNSIMLMLAHGRVWLRKNSSRLGKSSVAIVYMFAKNFVSTMPTTSCATHKIKYYHKILLYVLISFLEKKFFKNCESSFFL